MVSIPIYPAVYPMYRESLGILSSKLRREY
jgi:hypothetical protein